jgi:hypothetical protein
VTKGAWEESRHKSISKNREVLDLLSKGNTISEISQHFGVSYSRGRQICLRARTWEENVAQSPLHEFGDTALIYPLMNSGFRSLEDIRKTPLREFVLVLNRSFAGVGVVRLQAILNKCAELGIYPKVDVARFIEENLVLKNPDETAAQKLRDKGWTCIPPVERGDVA